MFAILFMNMFAGTAGFCDLMPSGVPNYNINREMCGTGDNTGRWRNYDFNFENIYQSLVSLFVLSTLEGWPDYMY
jgi:hypothetical protein